MQRGAPAFVMGLVMGISAACGTGGGDRDGITISVYYAPENNFAKVVESCNQQAGQRYRIEYNVLPRGADDQRVQLARRLAARDSAIDVLGVDVTWTPEFASAGWIREWTG